MLTKSRLCSSRSSRRACASKRRVHAGARECARSRAGPCRARVPAPRGARALRERRTLRSRPSAPCSRTCVRSRSAPARRRTARRANRRARCTRHGRTVRGGRIALTPRRCPSRRGARRQAASRFVSRHGRVGPLPSERTSRAPARQYDRVATRSASCRGPAARDDPDSRRSVSRASPQPSGFRAGRRRRFRHRSLPGDSSRLCPHAR